MGVPAEHVAERLVRDDPTGEETHTGGLAIKVAEQAIDQPGYLGEQTAIVTEERAERFRHGEGELSVRETEENLGRHMLGEQDRTFAATGWTEVETLAGLARAIGSSNRSLTPSRFTVR